MPKTIADIVKEYLVQNGYDGLCNDAGECGCLVEDLFPCCEADIHCEPGHKAPCPSTCGDHDWHIVPGEPRFGVKVPFPPVKKSEE
jgi:hypothetical protein